jgi:hypothetical protein
MASACGKHGRRRDALKVLMGQPDGKRIVYRKLEQLAGMLKVFTEHYFKSHTITVCFF